MPEIEIVFGGLSSLEYDERVDIDHALTCDDCNVDYGGIQPRNGYRAASASAPGSGTVQGVWRFRPKSPASSPNDARTITVRGGNALAWTDPSAETASDGTSASPSGASAFGATANISAAQLGKYLYIGSDAAATAWQRVKPDFTMESISALQPGATPTVTYSTLSILKFNPAGVTLGHTTSNTTVSTVFTDWVNAAPSNSSNSLTLDLTGSGTQNWDAYGWIAVMLTPSTQNHGNNSVTISISTSSGSGFELIGTIYDTPGTDSPCIIYCPLTGVTSGTLGAVRYMQFSSNNTSAYEVYGLMLVPTAPAVGIQQYFLDTFSSSSQQSSGLFPPLLPNGTGGISVTYVQNNIVIPSFHAVVGRESGFSDVGTLTLDPTVLANNSNRFFNQSAPTAFPSRDKFASIPTFTGTAPAGSYDTLRLWRQTETGIRLVKSISQTPTAGYAISDDQGIYTLTNQLYVAGGPPPACMCMCAVGGRLIAGGDPANPARFYVSSYLPFGSDTDPFPQFPAIPNLVSDGWAADLAPTSAEQILWCGEGDKQTYLISNEACYLLASTDAPLYAPPPFFEVWKRGVVSRRGGIWVEDTLFWAAHDGVYMARNRSFGGELTETVNRLYKTWLLPDSTTVMGYQDRKLYIQRGTRQLRYDFITKTWSRATLAHTPLHSAGWRDPTGTIQQLWLYASDGNLYRWQPGTYWGDTNRATSDNGTAIGNWVYSTGYDTRTIRSMMEGMGNFNTRVQMIFTHTDGAMTISIYKDGSTFRSKTQSTGMHELAMPPDMKSYVFRVQYTAANSVRLLRGMWQRTKISAKGG